MRENVRLGVKLYPKSVIFGILAVCCLPIAPLWVMFAMIAAAGHPIVKTEREKLEEDLKKLEED